MGTKLGSERDRGRALAGGGGQVDVVIKVAGLKECWVENGNKFYLFQPILEAILTPLNNRYFLKEHSKKRAGLEHTKGELGKPHDQ